MFYHKISFKVDHGREKYEKIKVCLQFLNFFLQIIEKKENIENKFRSQIFCSKK